MNTSKIFQIRNTSGFLHTTLKVFNFQYQNNKIYRRYCNYLKKNPGNVKQLTDIPFLPIEFFKLHEIKAFSAPPEEVFLSSGTTGMQQSKHYVYSLKLYEQSFLTAFELFYGKVQQYTVLALLPAYLERKGSSLIYMVNKLIEKSASAHSGFYLYNHNQLFEKLQQLEQQNKKVLLIGVSFALLDFAEKYAGKIKLKNTIVMETGGMKGRRKEILRTELHQILQTALGLDAIHSEYGMTELLSQAYSQGGELFRCPPWMKILIRDTYDPFACMPEGKSGGINVIDLANVYSCSFIETMDLGKLHTGGAFEVLGRFDNSDIRGCNLMVN